MEGGKVSTMLCPTNPTLASENIEDLEGNDTASGKDGCAVDRLQTRFCQTSAGAFNGTGNITSQRAEYIAVNLFEKGYNTNYVAHYFLVRTEPRMANGTS